MLCGQPTPLFLPGESHGQRSLGGHSPGGCGQTQVKRPSMHTNTDAQSLSLGVLPLHPHGAGPPSAARAGGHVLPPALPAVLLWAGFRVSMPNPGHGRHPPTMGRVTTPTATRDQDDDPQPVGPAPRTPPWSSRSPPGPRCPCLDQGWRHTVELSGDSPPPGVKTRERGWRGHAPGRGPGNAAAPMSPWGC